MGDRTLVWDPVSFPFSFSLNLNVRGISTGEVTHTHPHPHTAPSSPPPPRNGFRKKSECAYLLFEKVLRGTWVSSLVERWTLEFSSGSWVPALSQALHCPT